MADQQGRIVGRYALYNAIAAGGMATVHLGRLMGAVGFSRTVAIKRLHAQFASDPEFVSMFLDEARVAARIRHPNVVPTLDVVSTDGELFLVMEYVAGESISRIARVLRERMQVIPVRVMSAIISGVLHGLHAAHEARDERGQPLGIVHRDVSPQNVLLGADGVPKVLDFGVAKAAGRIQTTKEGQIKGKLSYMPPEQLRGAGVSRQTDIYSAGVMLWELVTGERLFSGDNEGIVVGKVLEGNVEPPSNLVHRNRHLGHSPDDIRAVESLDSTILRALSMNAEHRFATARDMAVEIERLCPPATASECADWLETIAQDVLASRAAMVAEIESSASQVLEESRDPHMLAALRRAAVNTGPHQQLSEAPHAPASGPHSSTVLAAPGLQYAAYAHLDGPPVTQPSSISVASQSLLPHPPSEAGHRRAAAITAVVGILLGVSVLLAALYYKEQKSREAAATQFDSPPMGEPFTQPTTSPVTPTAAVEGDAPIPTGVPIAPVTPIAPPPTVAPTTNPTPTPTAAIPVVTPKVPGPKRLPVPPKPPSSASGDDCVYFDAQGVKKYRQHCLGK